jgi:hypothetical protein
VRVLDAEAPALKRQGLTHSWIESTEFNLGHFIIRFPVDPTHDRNREDNHLTHAVGSQYPQVTSPTFWATSKHRQPEYAVGPGTPWTVPLAIQGFQSEYTSSYGPINAFTIMTMLSVLIVYLLFQRYFVSGAFAGSVKG